MGDDPEATAPSAPEPISAIYPSEPAARAAFERARRRMGDEACFLLPPQTGERALSALCGKVSPPASLRRRLLRGGLIAGLAAGLLLAVVAAPVGAAWQVEAPLLLWVGAFAALGSLAGGMAGIIWSRRQGPDGLDYLHSALRHGHWGIVVFPRTRHQSHELVGLIEHRPGEG
jgi:hypothetical protein